MGSVVSNLGCYCPVTTQKAVVFLLMQVLSHLQLSRKVSHKGCFKIILIHWSLLMGKNEHCMYSQWPCPWTRRETMKVPQGDGKEEAVLGHSGDLG